jgi:hypothetical protein
MKSASRVTASALGAYAGLLGAVHGYFEILQGNVAPNGLMINAIGPPCQPEMVAHACFPAMTVIPNFLVTGILAVVVGLTAAIWAAAFVQRKRGVLILVLLSLSMLVVGGGFVPTFVGLIAAYAGTRIHAPPTQQRTRLSPRALHTLAKLWPWSLVAYFAWVFPAQWLLGRFFNAFLLNAGLILFFCDLGLPLLAVSTGFAHDTLKIGGTSR